MTIKHLKLSSTIKPLTYARTAQAEDVLPISNPRNVPHALLIAAALFKRHVENALFCADVRLYKQTVAPISDALRYCETMQIGWWSLVEDTEDPDAERTKFMLIMSDSERAVFDHLFGELHG